MCCNGTLFNYVTLVPDDLPKLEKYPQLRFTERNGQGTFGEPCILHTGSGCSAYDDRPGTCSRYICGVLKAVAKDELTEIEAVGVLKEARALVENVKELLPFPPGEPLAVSTWDGAPDGVSDEARLAWDRAAYHLKKYLLLTLEEAPPETATRPIVADEGAEDRANRTKRETAPKGHAEWPRPDSRDPVRVRGLPRR
jgi:hypothetical protein